MRMTDCQIRPNGSVIGHGLSAVRSEQATENIELFLFGRAVPY